MNKFFVCACEVIITCFLQSCKNTTLEIGFVNNKNPVCKHWLVFCFPFPGTAIGKACEGFYYLQNNIFLISNLTSYEKVKRNKLWLRCELILQKVIGYNHFRYLDWLFLNILFKLVHYAIEFLLFIIIHLRSNLMFSLSFLYEVL